MKRIVMLLVALSSGLCVNAVRADDVTLESVPPVTVKTVPAAGSDDVDPKLTEIRVTFSKDMQEGGWSWATLSKNSFPKMDGKPKYLADKRTCVLPVKLEPGQTYAIWINSEKFNNFKDTDGRSAVPTCWCSRPRNSGAGRTSRFTGRFVRSNRLGMPEQGRVVLIHDDARGTECVIADFSAQPAAFARLWIMASLAPFQPLAVHPAPAVQPGEERLAPLLVQPRPAAFPPLAEVLPIHSQHGADPREAKDHHADQRSVATSSQGQLRGRDRHADAWLVFAVVEALEQPSGEPAARGDCPENVRRREESSSVANAR